MASTGSAGSRNGRANLLWGGAGSRGRRVRPGLAGKARWDGPSVCSPRETGRHNAPSGERAPRVGWSRKRSWTTRWQSQTYATAPGIMAEAGHIGYRRRAPGLWKPADEASRAGSVQRSCAEPGQPSTRYRQNAGNDRNARATRERSNRRALTKARCLIVCRPTERPCAPIPVIRACRNPGGQADCGQWVEQPWATSLAGLDARPIREEQGYRHFGGTCGRGFDCPSLSRLSVSGGNPALETRSVSRMRLPWPPAQTAPGGPFKADHRLAQLLRMKQGGISTLNTCWRFQQHGSATPAREPPQRHDHPAFWQG